MSVRSELLIQADDLTMVQGEKAKDYNVIITSTTGSPLESIPVTIAFYNKNYSFVREATTNEYGVASVPLYLGGDSWFVDVHFKGNETYNPKVVTREITIEKFMQLQTYFTSENLVINVDEESMNGTYYTVYLKDEYDRPVIREPVTIEIEPNDGLSQYCNMVLKTDEDGKIEVPFLSNNENVTIYCDYFGCTRYKPSSNVDVVAFEQINPRNTFQLRFDRVGNYNYLQYKIGNGEWAELSDEDRVFLNPPVVNKQTSDKRTSNVGWIYLDSMATGTYRVTLSFDGTKDGVGTFANLTPFCRTFEYVNSEDTRISLADWIAYQGGSDETEFTISNNKTGDLAHITLKLDYELPYEVVTLLARGGSSTINYYTLPTYEQSDGFYKRTILEYDIINPTRNSGGNTYEFVQSGSTYLLPPNDFDLLKTVNLTTSSKKAVTLTQTGLGNQGQTYQNIDIIATSTYADIHEKVNEYCILNFANTDTDEIFNFYSYLIDNTTPIHLAFNLGIGYWRMIAISKDTTGYKGAYRSANVHLTTDSIINPPTDTIIADSDNYTNLGTDNPTFSNQAISTTTSLDDIHSIMSLEFTDSNYYILSFNMLRSGNKGTFIIGSDPNLTTLDGLFISPTKATLYSDGTIVDEVIFTESPFKSSPLVSGVRIQRDGNHFTILVDGNIIYKTDLLNWNTFGVYQQGTGSSVNFSNFKLEPYTVTEISPLVNEYDGTIFGSDWHLEFREDHLNLIDYGMLPTGAVGGGLVLLNDVPLPKDIDWDLNIDITYNNKRYERLNELYGEIQARVFEDISTTESTLEYSNVLCSPAPIPNAKTIFTRHSDEGTLYYVKPNYLISDELGKVMQRPQYMCNPYIQYKGGVEIQSETGISLFSLDNAFSPVYIGNDLVRAEFHRRSGYIVISRFDESDNTWYSANILKLSNNLKLSLNEYNDDYASVSFGDTTWEFYRGRPFIVVKHPNTDIRILKLVDRVYCETIENEESMGFIEEHNLQMSTFNPKLSIQQFDEDLHIGQSIKLDGFELYDVDGSNNVQPLTHDATMQLVSKDDTTALKINKNFNGKLGLNFPTNGYLTKPSSNFSLLVQDLDVNAINQITVKARGFDENGAVAELEDVQYGIWEQSRVYGGTSHIANITKDDLYVSFVDGTSTKTATLTGTGDYIQITNTTTDNATISTVTIDENHINTYDYSYTYPCIVEFDLLDFESPSSAPTRTRLQFYDGTNNSNCGLKQLGTGHIKAVCSDGLQEYYCDGELKYTTELPLDNFRVALQTHYSISLKNLTVTTVPPTYIDSEQLYISKDANNVDTATITTNNDEYTITYNNSSATVGTVSLLETSTNYAYNTPITVEFDIVSYTSPSGANVSTRLQFYDKTNNSTCSFVRLTETSGHIKAVVKDGLQQFYCDGELKGTTRYSLQNFRIAFQTFGEMTIKNIRLTKGDIFDNGLRVNFTDCPSEVEYIDFVIIFDTLDSTTITMKEIMAYDGDAELNWDIDRGRENARKVKINFDETYYANLYFDKDPIGLSIIRPNQMPFTLQSISASEETVLAPYMKKCSQWDKPSQVFLEYLNANRQTIDIDWEDF